MIDTDRAGHRYLVLRPSLDGYGAIDAPQVAEMTERHRFELPLIAYRPCSSTPQLLKEEGARGAILVLDHGLPSRRHLRLLAQMQARGLRTLLAWPREKAVEVVDRERLASLRRHWLAAVMGNRIKAWRCRRGRAGVIDRSGAAATAVQVDTGALSALTALVRGEAESLRGHLAGGVAALRAFATAETAALAEHFAGGLTVLDRVRTQTLQLDEQIAALKSAPGVSVAGTQTPRAGGAYDESDLPSVRAFLNPLLEAPRPVPISIDALPQPAQPLPGTGVYLRLDFWAPFTSGGSYGHTCFQARALARTCQDFVCITANRFALLDELGVRQVTIQARDNTQTEANLLGMNAHYAERLGPLFAALRPAFIFERVVLGNAVGAWVSRTFGIPYIVEYNGSEISIKRSFEGRGYRHEDLLLAAEEAAFRQATLISVVSDHVAEDVARRGIPRQKILVNPNAVDLDAYAPAPAEEANRIRASLGFSPQHRVVGFIGTFGGWHGIDVLAAALPAIVKADERIRVLLIGDGHLKPLVRDAVAASGIADRVVDVGRVSQEKGAELLKACDILVSPHSRHMIDSPFFGSPTKLFEYMAMGAGIVASDLEQIGKVLSPALTTAELAAARENARPVEVGDKRAILCKPGDVAEFTQAVVALVRDPGLCAALGRNARAAAARYYTWDQHVRNLWLKIAGRPAEGYAEDWRRGK